MSGVSEKMITRKKVYAKPCGVAIIKIKTWHVGSLHVGSNCKVGITRWPVILEVKSSEKICWAILGFGHDLP